MHAQEAVELLRAFYLRGNPNGATFALRAVTPLGCQPLCLTVCCDVCAAPKPHRTLQPDLDVSTLGAPAHVVSEQGQQGAGAMDAART